MWRCPKCKRIFEKAKQPHSCKKVPLEKHFEKKDKAKEIFNHLVNQINQRVGTTKTISIPCCIHLFGNYDFLAALPKKDKLEIRFSLDRKIDNPRIKISVPMSSKVYKNCLDLKNPREIDKELIDWLKKSYYLKAK